MENPDNPIKGRGAQINPANHFQQQQYTQENMDTFEEPLEKDTLTQYFEENPKKIISENNSPDLPFIYSINPYQGCEHGCIYCYARNTHAYWGLSAGLDFERKIMVKKNAPELLIKTLDHPKYKLSPITLSGNTDPYQPAERKYQLTKQLLEILLEYKHPVSIITKNSLILRDIDLLAELAKLKLILVNLSITTLDEKLRQKLEPRTTTAIQRLKIIETLSAHGVPVNVMIAPLIPSINDHEVVSIIKEAANRGAVSAGYTFVRLNGDVALLFEDWINKLFPDRASRVLEQIKAGHGGKPNDSRWGTRMKGEGKIAESIRLMFHMAKKKYLSERGFEGYDLKIFERPEKGQLKLF